MIISMAELEKYFGKEATPAKMKEQIMTLLDEWKEKQPPELAKAPKKMEKDKLTRPHFETIVRRGPAPPAKGSVVIYPPSPPIFLYSREWAVKGAAHRRFRRLALDGLPRLCYFQRRGGVYISSRAAPFPMTGKGRGDWAEVSFFNEWRF